ncbi:interaptin-like [Macrobrachium nipponense]|uniref:interaptin-like n=1 Tax=Macrobrachium nipponense TaxID=159736 RepID=UPI0030C8CD35
MIGTVNIVFDAGMAHLICGVMVLLLIFSALPAFVFNKLMQKRRNNKELTLTQDKVERLQQELEAARRRNHNLHAIIRNKIKKDTAGLMTNEEVDREVRHIQDLLDLADETDVKIQEAESKVEAFGSENQKLRKEIEDNEKALADYRKENVELKELNMALEKDLFENKRHIQDLENINVAKEKELCQKKRQIQGLEDINMAMKTQLSEKNRHIECLEGMNVAMENELSEVKRHIQGLEVANREKEETLCEKERQIEDVIKKNALKEQQLEDYRRLLDELQKEIGTLESKAQDFDALESQNRRNEQNLLACEQQIENLQKKLEERNEEVNKLVQCEMEVENLRKELEDRQKDLSKLVQYEMEVEQSRKELEDRRKDVNKLVHCDQELEQLRKELEDKEKHINKLVSFEVEFERLRKEYDAKQVALVEMAGLIERDEKIIFDFQRKVEELRGEIKDKNKERDGHLTSEATLVQNLAKSELYISELTTEVEMLRSQKAELVNQLEENMNHLKSKQCQVLDLEQKPTEDAERYQEEKDNIEKVIKEKEKEIEHFKQEREDNLKETQDLRIQIALREENLQECQQEIEVIIKELEKRQKDIEELVCWNLRKEEELKMKDFQIEKTEKMVEELRQLQFERSLFQERMNVFENKISEQVIEITCLSEEVQQKNNLLEEGIAHWDSLNKKLECVEMENNHLKKLAAEAKERQIAAEGALNDLFIKIQRNENLITDKQREVDELRSKLEERNTEDDKLVQCEKEVEVLRKELKKKDLEIKKGKEEAKQHAKQMDRVGGRLQEMVAAFNKIT